MSICFSTFDPFIKSPINSILSFNFVQFSSFGSSTHLRAKIFSRIFTDMSSCCICKYMVYIKQTWIWMRNLWSVQPILCKYEKHFPLRKCFSYYIRKFELNSVSILSGIYPWNSITFRSVVESTIFFLEASYTCCWRSCFWLAVICMWWVNVACHTPLSVYITALYLTGFLQVGWVYLNMEWSIFYPLDKIYFPPDKIYGGWKYPVTLVLYVCAICR